MIVYGAGGLIGENESMKIKHDGKVFRVESNRTRGVFYPVEYSMMLQRWVCTCADFRHRRLPTGQNCKHIEAVIKFIDETPTEELGGIKQWQLH